MSKIYHAKNNSKYYGVTADGHKQHVPKFVAQRILNHRQNIAGFNACYALLINENSLLDAYQAKNPHAETTQAFQKGFAMARQSALNGIKAKIKELNKK